jgi:hypothetical protein
MSLTIIFCVVSRDLEDPTHGGLNGRNQDHFYRRLVGNADNGQSFGPNSYDTLVQLFPSICEPPAESVPGGGRDSRDYGGGSGSTYSVDTRDYGHNRVDYDRYSREVREYGGDRGGGESKRYNEPDNTLGRRDMKSMLSSISSSTPASSSSSSSRSVVAYTTLSSISKPSVPQPAPTLKIPVAAVRRADSQVPILFREEPSSHKRSRHHESNETDHHSSKKSKSGGKSASSSQFHYKS